MVFTSHVFLFYFLLLSLGLYYTVPRNWRHPVLTAVSYLFYGWWNPWFVLLMAGGTIVDYGCGKVISAPEAGKGQRKLGLWLSVGSNLLVLGFFKYAAWGAGTAASLLQWTGLPSFVVPDFIQRIVLPVGISFYIFQSMSYCIDLYRREAPPARSLGDFACFVSLFPQLVAGPIVRYGSIAEQLRHREHTITGFAAGMARFCLGFSKKIVLADPMGGMADAAFGAGPGSLGTGTAWIGVVAYAFQIYFDFSAYSDMAIGLGRMFGFRFVENFDSPYRSASLTEFWRRWHISLSTFLRDYLYIPLGGNRLGEFRTYANLMTVMLLGGLWHGASTTFLVWGGIHGLMLVLERWRGRQPLYGPLPKPLRVGLTFVVLLVTWVFFRADTMDTALRYLGAMFTGNDGGDPASDLLAAQLMAWPNMLWMAGCSLVVWLVPNSQQWLGRVTTPRVAVCVGCFVLSLGIMFAQGFSPFLYFQF